MKTRKALIKRFKTTKSGKVLRRATGQDHFRAKKSGKQIRRRRKYIELPKGIRKKLRKMGVK